MASIESQLYYYLLRLINKKKFLEMQFAFGKFDFYNSKEPPEEILKICDVEKRQVEGRNIFRLTPKTKPSGKHILYLHGGAYVQNFVKQHWKFLSMLVQQTHCTITAPDYPLAPESNYLQAFQMVIPLYREILLRSGPGDTILMGDSAGGGFALALAQKVRCEELLGPSKCILLSPWLDITLKNPEIAFIEPADPFLSVRGLRKAGLVYAGNSDPDNFMLSPVNGPLDRLPELSIFIGSRDILVSDARRLNSLAHERGVVVNYREYKDMVHVWMLLNFRESKLAKKEIMDLINEKKSFISSKLPHVGPLTSGRHPR